MPTRGEYKEAVGEIGDQVRRDKSADHHPPQMNLPLLSGQVLRNVFRCQPLKEDID